MKDVAGVARLVEGASRSCPVRRSPNEAGIPSPMSRASCNLQGKQRDQIINQQNRERTNKQPMKGDDDDGDQEEHAACTNEYICRDYNFKQGKSGLLWLMSHQSCNDFRMHLVIVLDQRYLTVPRTRFHYELDSGLRCILP